MKYIIKSGKIRSMKINSRSIKQKLINKKFKELDRRYWYLSPIARWTIKANYFLDYLKAKYENKQS